VVWFGFKVSTVPFHMWTPDVYEGAPSTVTAFMSAGPKAAGLAAFIRVFAEAFPALQENWTALLWILAVLTMTVGNVMALRQSNVKRLLAYSSIAHVGYALVGFVAASELGITAVLFYMLGYTFMNIGAFAVVAFIGRKNEEKTSVQDYTGVGYRYPLVGLAMAIFLFSLAGIPPTAGFTGKFYLFLAAVKAGYVGLAVIAVLNSVVGVYYYLRITVVMYMREEGMGEDLPRIRVTPALATALVISIYGTLRLGILPQEYIAMARDSFLAF
jgi:NADH-quinone oxidoreductase subunit N